MSAVNDLEDRLVESRSANHIASQLLRSGTSPAPNYAEARGAESRKDFIHKMKIGLKELRETHVWLKIVKARQLVAPELMEDIIDECNQLVSIFVASARTADANRSPK